METSKSDENFLNFTLTVIFLAGLLGTILNILLQIVTAIGIIDLSALGIPKELLIIFAPISISVIIFRFFIIEFLISIIVQVFWIPYLIYHFCIPKKDSKSNDNNSIQDYSSK